MRFLCKFVRSDGTHLARDKARADADFYTVERKAASNKLLLTKDYLELRRIEAVQNNNKVSVVQAVTGCRQSTDRRFNPEILSMDLVQQSPDLLRREHPVDVPRVGDAASVERDDEAGRQEDAVAHTHFGWRRHL